jgi:pyrophosphatase PpaX
MIKTILFDLDGTIVDTNELIIATFLYALQGQTTIPYTREHIIMNMGRSLVDQMQEYTGKEDVDEIIQVYRKYNVSKHDELVRGFPHVGTVIAALHAAGIRMGVVTSKVRKTVHRGLELFGLNRYLDIVVTVDDVSHPKPDPEGIEIALRALNADPSTTLMVGDSQYDILAAQNAGVRSAGVAWSLKGEAYLREFKPDYMLNDMRDLLDIVGIKRAVL